MAIQINYFKIKKKGLKMSKKVRLTEAYKKAHYDAEDIITKWCMDNRVYNNYEDDNKEYMDVYSLPQGYVISDYEENNI